MKKSVTVSITVLTAAAAALISAANIPVKKPDPKYAAIAINQQDGIDETEIRTAIDLYKANEYSTFTDDERREYALADRIYNGSLPAAPTLKSTADSAAVFAANKYSSYFNANLLTTGALYTVSNPIVPVAGFVYDKDLSGEDTSEQGRREAVQAVLEHYTLQTDGNVWVRIEATSRELHKQMEYDPKYRYVPLLDAIRDGHGVCVHYADIGCIMLNLEGIPAHVTAGETVTPGVTDHKWIVAYPDGSPVIVDFTQDISWGPIAKWSYKEQTSFRRSAAAGQ